MQALLAGFFAALGAGIAAVLFVELRGLAGWASRRCIATAVALLPPTTREDRAEEWAAESENWTDGAVGRLVWSAGLILAALRIGAHDRREAVETQPRSVEDSILERVLARTEHGDGYLALALEFVASEDVKYVEQGLRILEASVADPQLRRRDRELVLRRLEEVTARAP